MMDRRSCIRIHDLLAKAFGGRGWWPLPSRAGQSGFDERGYHPGLPELLLSAHDRFQICAGALLTQNTAWTNAERALLNLLRAGVDGALGILRLSTKDLEDLIRPSGYYRQKAQRLKILFSYLDDHSYLVSGKAPPREELLNLKGIGPETADSILLYAFGRTIFVIDAYTLRLFSRLSLLENPFSYERAQASFHACLPPETALFSEYHALIVEECKIYCRKKDPRCPDCPLRKHCARVGVD